MRLIGSFQTITIHTRAGSVTSSADGRSTSTGAGATCVVLILLDCLSQVPGWAEARPVSADRASDHRLARRSLEHLDAAGHRERGHELVNVVAVLAVQDQEEPVGAIDDGFPVDLDPVLAGVGLREMLQEHWRDLWIAGRAGLSGVPVLDNEE